MLWWVFLVTVIHVRRVYGVSDRFSKNIRDNRICHLSALLEVLLLHFLYWTRFWCTYKANKTYTLWWTYVVGWGEGLVPLLAYLSFAPPDVGKPIQRGKSIQTFVIDQPFQKASASHFILSFHFFITLSQTTNGRGILVRLYILTSI